MFDSSNPFMASSSPSSDKKYWWLTNRKMVERYIREARMLISTQQQSEITAALGLLEAALAVTPKMEVALELKSRCLLYLRRFKEVADLLQDYIPSLKMVTSDDSSSSTGSSSDNSSTHLSRERVKLLNDSLSGNKPAFKCFSVSDLTKKFMAGLSKNDDKECQWRYSVLGQACCHLGLMEDALVLLQTGKRLATAALRRESISLTDDIFSFKRFPIHGENQPQTPPRTEADNITHLLCHIKLLLRRKAAAIAALDAGLYSESVRHFSKILDGRRGAPQGFLAECYVHRASAYRSAGRFAEAIADCNRALALDTSSIDALTVRATLFETIRCLPDSLHDLEHLKLLYNSMLRDRKLPGPVWKRQHIQYREIPGKLCSLATKINQLKQRVAAGETGNVDYYALIGLRRGCSKSELERAHLLLVLKHKPDKSSSFIERCEFADEKEMDSVRDRAKLSALLLYRLIQKGQNNVSKMILEDEKVEMERKKAAIALQDAIQVQQQIQIQEERVISVAISKALENNKQPVTTQERVNSVSTAISEAMEQKHQPTPASVYQGVFCRDLAVVGNLLCQAGYNRPIPVKYEGLTC